MTKTTVNKKESEGNIRFEKFVETLDDWYPNFDGNKVEVALVYFKKQGAVRLSAWGNDDFGMILHYKGTAEQCEMVFKDWKETIYDKIPEPCTKKYFRHLGLNEF